MYVMVQQTRSRFNVHYTIYRTIERKNLIKSLNTQLFHIHMYVTNIACCGNI